MNRFLRASLALASACSTALVLACSSADPPGPVEERAPLPPPTSTGVQAPDAAAPDDATVPVEADGDAPDAAVDPCSPRSADESVYCQGFDGRPAVKVGAWTVRGEPTIDDAGRSLEDTREFWSAPASRRLGLSTELYARVTGPLPAKRVVVRFRFRPDLAPYASRVGHHLAFVSLGDSTAAVVWGDLGAFDPGRAGQIGYALVHHVLGATTDKVTPPLARFVSPKVWSAVDLSLDATGVAKLVFDGVEAATVTGPSAASTSASAGLGPYFTSTAGSPLALSGNVDDFSVRVER